MAGPGRRGATDRLLLGPHGDILFAEFKREVGAVTTPAQIDFRYELKKRGLRHYEFTTYEEAIRCFQEFL